MNECQKDLYAQLVGDTVKQMNDFNIELRGLRVKSRDLRAEIYGRLAMMRATTLDPTLHSSGDPSWRGRAEVACSEREVVPPQPGAVPRESKSAADFSIEQLDDQALSLVIQIVEIESACQDLNQMFKDISEILTQMRHFPEREGQGE